jgi:hypothetical protein
MAAKKNIMREFALDEISAVTQPAQKGARMLIMKRADPLRGGGGGGGGSPFTKEQIAEMIAKGQAVLTGETDGHTHLIMIDDYTCGAGGGLTYWDGSDHQHPFTIDDSGNITVGMARGHTHTAPAIARKSADDFAGEQPATNSEVEMTEAQLAKLLALAGMNDAHKAYHARLDEAGQTAFEKLDGGAREAEVAAALAKANGTADPVLYKMADGTEVRKSDGPVAASLAKTVDALTTTLAATKETALAAEAETLAKSWTHIGKPHEEKVAMAKGILDLPVAQKDAALAAINVGKDSLAPIFKNLGALGGASSMADADPVAKLHELAKARETADGISYAKAYDAVIQTTEGKALYEQSLQPTMH